MLLPPLTLVRELLVVVHLVPHDYMLLLPLTLIRELLVVERLRPHAKIAAVQRHEEQGHGGNVQHLGGEEGCSPASRGRKKRYAHQHPGGEGRAGTHGGGDKLRRSWSRAKRAERAE